jgi:hypothetical protein
LLNRWFLSLVDVLPAAPLSALLVSFPDRHLPHRAAGSIAGFFVISTSCPPRRSLHLVTLLINVWHAAPLAASHVSFSCQQLARRAARFIACFFLLPTTFPPRRSLHRLISSLVDVWPSALLAASLVSFACHCLDRRTGRQIAHASLSLAAPVSASLISLSRPPRRSPDRSFLFVARCALAGFCDSIAPPLRRSQDRSFPPLIDNYRAATLVASLV